MRNMWVGILVVMLVACGGTDEADVAADAAADALAGPTTPPPSDDTPTPSAEVAPGVTMTVLAVEDAGPSIANPEGLVIEGEAQGTWAAVQFTVTNDGDAPLQPSGLTQGQYLTDGASTWQVQNGPTLAYAEDQGDADPTEQVGPGFEATTWALADVPEGTDVTGMVISDVTLTVP